MKRVIKFRAWDKEDKRIIVHEQDFIPLKVTNHGVLRLNPHHAESLWEFVDSDRFDLMQFVGLTDKNGKEIYENDFVIINTISLNPRLVIFEKGAFYYKRGDNYPLLSVGDYDSDEIEIIGNLFANPELSK